MNQAKIRVHVEICLKPDCILSPEDIERAALKHFKSFPVFLDGPINLSEKDVELFPFVDNISVCDLGSRKVSFWQASLEIHVYRLSEADGEKDYLDGEEEHLAAAEQWELPNKMFVGLWESIVVDESIKSALLGYCETSMFFSEARVDPTIINWNRMALLYGPPGTGKTSLLKALAQKMFIRTCGSKRYQAGMLLEINSHSLFSKWFSESGKLVMKLFNHINDIADDEECMVAVLIDEVESISANRSFQGNDPGDAVRVVNAVLTSLDALRRRPNVMVLTTSNMMQVIDPAFQDRVDVSLYLGPPSARARYDILHSCLVELMERGIIHPTVSLSSDSSQVEENYSRYQERSDSASMKYQGDVCLSPVTPAFMSSASSASSVSTPTTSHMQCGEDNPLSSDVISGARRQGCDTTCHHHCHQYYYYYLFITTIFITKI